MDLRDLRAFVAVADHGGVARAASALYLSPSSVSHTITSLEADLGVRLFHRRARGMVLTDVGEAMLGPARRALKEVAATEAVAATADGQVTGRITVAPGRIFLSPVVELVARFHPEHPLVVVTLREPENNPVIAELVRSGEADFGVMSTESVPRDLVGSPVGVQTMALVVPSGHPLATRRSVSYDDLDGVDVIASPAGSPFRLMFDDLCRAAGTSPTVVAETDHLQTMLELVALGVGATVGTIESASILGDHAVAVRMEPPDARPMSLVTRDEARTPAAEAFWQFVLRHDLGG
jgi:DNA-binding transcriptional LysR family regulator